MTNAYDPAAIEPRWQAFWQERELFRTPNPGQPGFDPSKPKFYVLDMFPYPSGAGLHVGHPLGYVGTDIVARRKRMEGHNVLHPIGWDAFGLPTEQHAIRTGRPPAEITAENVATFKRQLQTLGLSYDWDREFATTDPKYYRWTQWIFARLYERGLAYQAEVPVWWCDELKTVLANEEVINGRSERGDFPCERRPLKQWMLKITEYADRLLDDLDQVDWPESVKTMQREWIGRSEGCEVDFGVIGHDEPVTVFTTRPDTLFGATFMVLAPEHPLVQSIVTGDQRAAVEEYIEQASQKSDLERTDLAKGKTGVFTGAYCLNPAFDESDERAKIPIWIADYVLASYGKGAIMAVPGQDERDWEFAETYDLPIIRTVQAPEGFEGAFTGEGAAINSGFLDGLGVADAKAKMIAHLTEQGIGRAHTNYRLRDWLFSRQRYWGEPFPILHKPDGTHQLVPDAELPVELPLLDDFAPVDEAAPLGRAQDWLEVTDPASGETWLRETNTMPNWAGSCWYYLRFCDPHNDQAAFSPEAHDYWGSVDLYVGGVEHAVLHLLYARFWHKVLFDVGVVKTEEPFLKLFNQGMLSSFAYKDATGRLVPVDEVEEKEDGSHVRTADGAPVEQIIAKMSKSLRNVFNPDEVVAEFGADTFRLYEMFMGPLAEAKPWNPRDVPGCRRFLDRTWRLIVDENSEEPARAHLLQERGGETGGDLGGDALALEKELAKSLKRVGDAFDHFNFNTAIAGLMTFVNEATKKNEALTRSQAERFVCALSPFAPHVAEELWSRLGHTESVQTAPWPVADERYLVEDEFELIVQIMGKLRARTPAPKDASKDQLEELAKSAAGTWLEGKEIKKTIVVPGRLVNFVVGG